MEDGNLQEIIERKNWGKRNALNFYFQSPLWWNHRHLKRFSRLPSFLPSSAGGRREEELVGLARQATCLRNTFPLLVFKDTGFKLQKTSRTVWESASDQERFRKRAAAVCQCWRTITVQSESESARTATTRKDTGQLGCNYKHGFRADVHCLPREHTKWCTMSGCKFFFLKKERKKRQEKKDGKRTLGTSDLCILTLWWRTPAVWWLLCWRAWEKISEACMPLTFNQIAVTESF